ncbi:MAG: hypothetical protein ACYS8X_03130 [Planctomycetota bacterium]|jgi:hypothetical protein
MRILTRLLLVGALGVLGCAGACDSSPVPENGAGEEGYAEDTMWYRTGRFSSKMLGAKQRSRRLPRTDLIAEFGEPDRKVDVQTFIDLCREAKADGRHGIPPVDEAYHMYYINSLGPSPTGPWQENKDFLRCQVWLYCWDEPEDFGLVSPAHEAEWHKTQSYFFLVRDEDVIADGTLIRTSKRVR